MSWSLSPLQQKNCLVFFHSKKKQGVKAKNCNFLRSFLHLTRDTWSLERLRITSFWFIHLWRLA